MAIWRHGRYYSSARTIRGRRPRNRHRRFTGSRAACDRTSAGGNSTARTHGQNRGKLARKSYSWVDGHRSRRNVGFDINNGGLPIYLPMYGTRMKKDQNLYNAFYGAKLRKKLNKSSVTRSTRRSKRLCKEDNHETTVNWYIINLWLPCYAARLLCFPMSHTRPRFSRSGTTARPIIPIMITKAIQLCMGFSIYFYATDPWVGQYDSAWRKSRSFSPWLDCKR